MIRKSKDRAFLDASSKKKFGTKVLKSSVKKKV